jgi:hypothetical protein
MSRAVISASSCRSASWSSGILAPRPAGRLGGVWPGRARRPPSTIPVLALVVAGAVACGEPAVLEVGRIAYTAEEIETLPAATAQELATLTSFGLAAADRRLADVAEPYVNRDLRSLVLQRAALEIGAAMAGLDEPALRAAYEEDPQPELTVRHLVVLAERWRPEEYRDSARARAIEALERARAGEDFAALAAEYSDEAGAAERGGLLQPGRVDSWVPEFWRAANALEEGELSGLVETEYGFHVLRLERREVVPFDEARDQVLEAVVGLAAALRRSARWLEDRTRGAVVDTAAVMAWQSGHDPGVPLVSWPDGDPAPYWPRDLDSWALTLPEAHGAALRRGPPEEVVDAVASAARNQVLVDHARDLGIEPTPSQRAAVEERWLTQLEGWAAALGFAGGQRDRAVKERALAGLEPHGQEAMLARIEVLQLAPVLRRLHPPTDAHPAR